MSLPSMLDDDFWGDDSSFIEKQLAIVVSIILHITSRVQLNISILSTLHHIGNNLTGESFAV